MNIETLSIKTDNVNGTLRRIWTIVEQRGWFVRSLLVQEVEGGVHTWVQVSPESSGRQIETLRRQIERLVNVRTATVIQRSRMKPSMFEEIPYTEAM